MLMNNPKKAATLIIGGMGKHMPKSAPMESEDSGETVSDYDVGLEATADQLINAIESKNTKGIVSAMKDFHEMCSQSREESDEMNEQTEYME